jgi:hypothetical protein
MNPRITSTTSAAICMALLCAVAIALRAATITVTNTNDSGAGSLRRALADANDGDTITFAVTGTIGLTSGELLVDKSITISGPGAANLAVDANANSRVLNIGSGRTVTISALAIRNGNASGNFPDDSGAGIYNDHAILTLTNCTISGNSAGGSGGGIFNDGSFGSASVEINDSIVLVNDSTFAGGAIFNDAYSGTATLNVRTSTLSGNSTAIGDGGGIYNEGESDGSATLQFSNSTLSGNTAGSGSGGAIYNRGFSGSANVQITNSTLSGNSADFYGGAVFNDGSYGNATAQLSNSTFSGNTAGDSVGGIYSDGYSGSATLEIGDTVLKAGTARNIFNSSGTVTSHGYNLSSDDAGGFLTGPGDQINTDPLLGSLQDNGGPTFTHALLPGSPAIDTGDPSFTPPPFFDQRGPGFDRIVNARIDIGSFEVQGPTPTPTPTPTPGAITLSAHGRRVQGRHTVDLSWNGSNAANIDIYRVGVVIATVPNNGAYKDFIGVRGGNARYIYKVCDAGTQNCSNQVTLRFGGPPL